MATDSKHIPPKTILKEHFFELFESLHARGFSVEISDYVESFQLLDALGEENLAELKFQLAPVICRNEEEQKVFYQVFDNFINTVNQSWVRAQDIKVLKKKLWQKILIYSAVVVLLLVSYFTARSCFCKQSEAPKYSYARSSHILVNERAHFRSVETAATEDSSSSQKQAEELTHTDISITWDFGDGAVIKDTLAVYHTFKDTGRKSVRLDFNSPSQKMNTLDTFFVCDKSPELSQLSPEVTLSETYFLIRSAQDHEKPLLWVIDGTDSLFSTKDSIPYTFKQAGLHSIHCKYAQQYCTHENSLTVEVIDDGFTLSGISNPENRFRYFVSNWEIEVCLLLFLVVITLLILWVNLDKRRHEKDEVSYLKDTELPQFLGDTLPLELDFPESNHLIVHEAFFVKWSAQLMKRIQSGLTRFDIRNTISSTIRNEGFYSPVYSDKNIKRNYLFLINKVDAESPAAHLFEFITQSLLQQQVDLEMYFFDQDPSVLYRKNSHAAIGLKQIQDKHYQSTLFIWSNSMALLDRNEAKIEDSLKELLSFWPNRVLITTLPAKDWFVNEKALASFFYMVPADTKGLADINRLLDNQVFDQLIIGSSLYTTYHTRHINFENINALETYIDHPGLFQGLCALAIYPQLKWNLLLRFLHAIDPSLLKYEHLLKLTRIPWVANAHLPIVTRFELLKKLDTKNEIKVRQTFIHLLEEAETRETDYAHNEKRLLLIINKFILYAHDPITFKAYQKEEKEFIALYQQNDIPDLPLKYYLEKYDPESGTTVKQPATNWKTPLDKPGTKTTELKEYVAGKLTAPKHTSITFWLRLVKAALVCTWILCVMAMAGKFFTWSPFVEKEKIIDQGLKLSFDKDTCYRKFSSGSPLIIHVFHNKDTVLSVTDSLQEDTVFIDKNLSGHINQALLFEIQNGTGKVIASSVVLSSMNLKLSLTGNCTETVQDTLNIVYADNSQKTSAENLKNFLSGYGFYTSRLIRENFTGVNRVDYFGPDNSGLLKQKAGRLDSLVENYFQQAFKLERGSPSYLLQKGGKGFTVWIKNTGKAKPQVSIKYNSLSARLLANRVKTCINNSQQLNTGTEYSADIRRNEINYFRASFKDSLEQVLSCLRTYFPEKNFKVSFSNRINAKLFAEILLFEDAVSCPEKEGQNTSIIYYDYNKSTLRPKAKETLDSLISELKSDPNKYANLRAYSDEKGGEDYNLKISNAYLGNIASYFKQQGIEGNRVSGISYGNKKPKAGFTLATQPENYRGTACNRRVEIELVTKTPEVQTPEPPKPEPKIQILISDTALMNDARAFAKYLYKYDYKAGPVAFNYKSSNSSISYRDKQFYEQAQSIKTLFQNYFPDLQDIPLTYDPKNTQDISIYIRKKEEPKKQTETFTTYLGGGNGNKLYQSIELAKKYGIILNRLESNPKIGSTLLQIYSQEYPEQKQMLELGRFRPQTVRLNNQFEITIELMDFRNESGSPFSQAESVLKISISQLR